MGYCRVDMPGLYDGAYFENYKTRDQSKTGGDLTRGRQMFVHSIVPTWAQADMVDVGIGGGRFVREADCLGTDINPEAVAWLKSENRYFDLERGHISIATFWDSLEHIHDPRRLLFNVTDYVFVSTPIYKDMNDCLKSKHYKPGEHVWYWTRRGMERFMLWLGFEMIARSEFEQFAGRESIESFAFKRKPTTRI